MTQKLCIVFVCQSGELELKGSLLAASIRKNASLTNIDLVAAIPDPKVYGDISATTKSLMQSLSVRCVQIASPFGSDYPIGNKLAAIGIPTEASTTVFMDSDILCLRPIKHDELMTNNLKAKPADLSTFEGDLAQWRLAYQFIGKPLPTERVRSTVSNKLMLPYFNAGLIAVPNGPEFSKSWISIAKQIDACAEILHKRPWLDQIALPVAAKSRGLEFTVLSEDFNFPAHLKCLDSDKLPKLCHYHSPDVIESESYLSSVVGDLCSEYTGLEALIGAHEAWHGILARARLAKSRTSSVPRFKRLITGQKNKTTDRPRKDFLITGLPRSGTSLLCNLLHKTEDVVVVNEPQEVFNALKDDPQCLGLGLMYRRFRTQIVMGKGIQNKIDEAGNVIEDTRFNDVRRHYLPDVNIESFSLATKNPLAYLTRLSQLCNAFPDMPKVVMIRHPHDVIHSWISSFEHLRTIDLSVIPFCYHDDPLLDGIQRELLNELKYETYLPVRRALYFNYLAEMIRRERHRIHVIRYEDLLLRPKLVMDKLSDLIHAKQIRPELLKTVRRSSNKKQLANEDAQAVNLLCSDFIEEWGYK